MRNFKAVSPSRTYVVFIYTKWLQGPERAEEIEPRWFTLPEDVENNISVASWYYLNKIDAFNVIEGFTLTKEEFDSVKKAE